MIQQPFSIPNYPLQLDIVDPLVHYRDGLNADPYITNNITPDEKLHGRFKRSPYYNYGYSYYGRRGYGRGYGYGSRYGGCYNCGYRPGRAVGAALLVGGAAFTGGLIGSRIGK